MIKVTATDTNTVSYEFPVILAPHAVKGIQILAQDKETVLNAKTTTTKQDYFALYPVATNPEEDNFYSDLTFTVSNKNFKVGFEEIEGDFYVVVRPVEGAANPYGTVKVTMKATDGSNVSAYTTVKFVQPDPAT